MRAKTAFFEVFSNATHIYPDVNMTTPSRACDSRLSSGAIQHIGAEARELARRLPTLKHHYELTQNKTAGEAKKLRRPLIYCFAKFTKHSAQQWQLQTL